MVTSRIFYLFFSVVLFGIPLSNFSFPIPFFGAKQHAATPPPEKSRWAPKSIFQQKNIKGSDGARESQKSPTRSIGSLCPCPIADTDCFCRTIKHIPIRSFGYNKSRQMVGMKGHVHQFHILPSYATITALLEYDRSFRSREILRNLFGSDIVEFSHDECIPLQQRIVSAQNSGRGESIIIQGSNFQGDARNPSAWLADYFYLPRSFQSVVTLNPKLSHIILNFDIYIGLDGVVAEGVYLRFYGPVVHAMWDLNICELIVEPASGSHDSHPPGYFSTQPIQSADLLPSFESYAQGDTPTAAIGTTDPIDSTIIYQPLNFSRLSRSSRTRTAVADVNIEIGWNLIQDVKYHLGLYLFGVAPASPKRSATYLLNPAIGNQGHWEAGLGLSASYIFWASRDGEIHLGIDIDARASHAFTSREQRTFDLTKKPNSAYMLAAKFGVNGDIPNPTGDPSTEFDPVGFELETGNGAAVVRPDPDKQFALEYAPVANLSTLTLNTSVDIRADAVGIVNLTAYSWSFDFGYNFWVTSRDRTLRPNGVDRDSGNGLAISNSEQAETWALKGDARMFGFEDDTNNPIPLSATEGGAAVSGGATIHNGQNGVILDGSTSDVNKNVDSAILAVNATSGTGHDNPVITLTNEPGTQIQINTSQTPLFLSADDLDIVHTTGMSHSIFLHVHHTRDGEIVTPHLGFGASVEFGINNNLASLEESPVSQDLRRVGVAVSQWAVWIKGGITFD